jgi:ribose transport system substrate-binding protein
LALDVQRAGIPGAPLATVGVTAMHWPPAAFLDQESLSFQSPHRKLIGGPSGFAVDSLQFPQICLTIDKKQARRVTAIRQRSATSGGTNMKKLLVLGAFAAMLASGTALADTSGKKIAFSNNYAGNSWRQAMLDSYGIVTKKAVEDKIVAAADVFTTADKEVPTQAAQVQNLILQGYDAIVINAASPDALNGAIKQACDAGIVVVSFDGIVTEPCAYRVVVDFKDMGKQEVEQMAKFQPKGGNLLEIRGLAGTSIDDAIHAGILEGVAAHPEFKIVGSVTGDWDQTTAQKAVATILPSLPDVVGIVDQGGDGYGAAQAFAAAGKPRPTIIMGNRQDELKWWKEQKEKDGYKTWSASIAPGVSTLAFWVAQQVLDGRKDIPHDLLVPYLAFTQDDFEAALPKIKEGGVATHEYTQEEALAAIKANIKQ